MNKTLSCKNIFIGRTVEGIINTSLNLIQWTRNYYFYKYN